LQWFPSPGLAEGLCLGSAVLELGPV